MLEAWLVKLAVVNKYCYVLCRIGVLLQKVMGKVRLWVQGEPKRGAPPRLAGTDTDNTPDT